MWETVKWYLVVNSSFFIGAFAQYQMPVFEKTAAFVADAILWIGDVAARGAPL